MKSYRNLTDMEHLSKSGEKREHVYLERYDFKRRTYCPLCRINLSDVDARSNDGCTTVEGICRRCALLVKLTVTPVERFIDEKVNY